MHPILTARQLLYSTFICLFLAFSYLSWLMVRSNYARISYPHCPSLSGQHSPVTVTAQPTCSSKDTVKPSEQTTEYDFSLSFTDRPSITVLDNSNASTTYGNCSNPMGDQEILSWSFDAKRDAQSYGLSFMQCNKAFKELDRPKTYQKSIGWISPADININWVKSSAIKGRYTLYTGPVYTRPNSQVQGLVHLYHPYLYNLLQ